MINKYVIPTYSIICTPHKQLYVFHDCSLNGIWLFYFLPHSNLPRNLDKRTTITIGDQETTVEASDLQKICDLGRGAYGIVEKMRHIPSGTIMAVKVSVLIAMYLIYASTKHVQWSKWVLFFFFTFLEDSSYSQHPRAETTFNGSGYIHAVVSLSTYSAVLWGTIYGGWCMDMHGSNGHFIR